MRILRCLILLLTVALVAPATAQDSQVSFSDPINRASPYDTYHSFLTATRRLEERYADYIDDKSPEKVRRMRHDLERIRRLFDLSAVPPSTRIKVGNAAIGYLYDILARLPPVPPGTIPGYNAALPSPLPTTAGSGMSGSTVIWTVPETDIQISRIDSGPNRGAFLFSAETVANLATYYHDIIENDVQNPRVYKSFHEEQINAAGPLIPEALVAGLPSFLKKSYYETPAWKAVIVIILSIALGMLSLIWGWFAYRRSAQLSASGRTWWRISVPLFVLGVVSIGERFVASQVNPAGTFAASELMLATGIQYLCVAWLIWLIVYLIADFALTSPRFVNSGFDPNLTRLSARALSIVLVAAVLAIGADKLGIPALGLAAGLGVGGVAIALASQSTLDNLFSGVSLFADRPFHIGDMIMLEEQTGQVEWIGPRSSRMRLRDGTLCTIPNGDLARKRIINLTKRDGCFIDQTFSIKSGCTPTQVAALLQALRCSLNENDLIEKKEGWPRTYLVGTFPGRMDIRVQARVLTLEYHVFLAEQEKLILAAISAMRDNGIDMAIPLAIVATNGEPG